ncbi:hypothetical protein VZT92_007625 [Zoarces viviparus]|uniref:Uncharacterized protein n=1 Tax=Zoarces viviparus TaxID=48416 RepID=A0AAW1FKS7_ZOAVI
MASRRSFHSQLSAIMETMARSALSQVCELVDEDLAELRLGLSQLMDANSALVQKVKSLECELTIVRSDAPGLCYGYPSVGVQTVRLRDGETHVSGSPSIEGIFGNDWCMDLWKDRDPSDPPQSSEPVATLLHLIPVSQIKEEADYVEDAVSCCQQETRSTEEHEESVSEEAEHRSVGHSPVGSTCSLSLDPDVEQVVCSGGNEEPTVQLISISDTEGAFSTHTIPIEEEEDDDGVQFLEESQQEPTMSAEGGPSNNNQDTLPANSDALDSIDDFNTLDVETARDPNGHRFPCTS